ncbi:MAG TPA: hypothetical protein VFI25_06925 [Planctomycetota bacterium]|nr:hypothetical protein [Planctomycetota bacterium]
MDAFEGKPSGIRAAALLFLCAACAAPDKRTEGRTALAQRLVAAAVERAVARLPLDPLEGRRVALRVVSPGKDDGPLLDAIVRDRLRLEGVDIAREDPVSSALAPFELAVTFHAASTDTETSSLGIPVLSQLAASVGAPGGAGDLSLYTRSTQRGVARVQAQLLERSSGRALATLGPFDGTASFSNLTLLVFVGPFCFTDLPEEGVPAAPLRPPPPRRGGGRTVRRGPGRARSPGSCGAASPRPGRRG